MNKLAVVRGFGGLRDFDIDYYKRCDKFDVTFICPLNGCLAKNSAKTVKLPIKPAFYLDPISILMRNHHLLSWVYFNHIEKYLQTTDIINTIETHFFVSKQCAEIAKKTKKPLVVYVSQNIPYHFSTVIPPYSKNTKLVQKNADLFIAISEKAKLYLLSLGVAEDYIHVIPPGVDINKFKINKHHKNVQPRILFVGGLANSKGLPELIKACRILWDNGFVFELWICGLGPLEPFVREFAKKYPIAYFGYVDNDSIAEIYQQCDIFCLPSKDTKVFGITQIAEQFGYVLVEAMASGLPVIASKCGAIPEVIGKENLLVSQGSVQELCNSLMILITDVDKRRKIGYLNRQRVLSNFNLDQQAEKLQIELLKLCS